MGAWGPGIFSDDTAEDVRDDYLDLLGQGLSGPQATLRVLEEWREALDDPDEAPVVWLALAATQWKHGRLEDDVKSRALEIIRTGAGLDLWEQEGTAVLRKRKAALSKLEEQLQTPQPPAKKVVRRMKQWSDLEKGDAISYRLKSGRYVIFRVTGMVNDKGGRSPVYELCDWIGDVVPSAEEIEGLPYKERPDGKGVQRTFIGQRREGDYPAARVQVIARGLSRTGQALVGHVYWKDLDKWLQEEFGWS